MKKELIDLYKDYDMGLINRREFLAKMAVIAGSTAAASSLLMLLENDYALAEVISKDDPRIQSEYINYPGESGDIRANLVTPRGEEKVPGVIVIH